MALDVGSWLSGGAAVPSSDPCGLFVDGSSAAVPLKRRDVCAEVCTDACYADTKETFSYISDADCTATFKFPLPPRSAVYSFVARIGDREVVTRVKPRAQAAEEYGLAVSQGHTAVLLSQSPSSASLYEVAVGNLEAHTEAVVELRYLRLLDALGDAVEWVHTATWVPPYIGSAGDAAAGLDKVAAAEPKFASRVPYALSYAVTVRSDTATVKSIESPEPITTAQTSPTTHLVTLAESVAQPSKDLTLLIERAPGARHSALRVERAGPTRPGVPRTVALATFVPRLEELPAAGAAAAAAAGSALQQELWLVVDCSGSMGGSPIQQARDAALFFVRDLPAARGVRFNITCFGSSHVSLYGSPRPYGADTERQAVAWIQQHVHASMGGTEILSTLQHIYASPISPGYSRQIIFLTDGGISGHEEQAVYDLVAKGTAQAAGANIFGGKLFRGVAPCPSGDAGRPAVLCLGIGHGVHRGLLDGMASRSGGVAAYVVDDEGIAKKAAFLKKCATSQGVMARPRLTARGALVRAVPHVMPQRIFAGEPLHVLLEVLICTPGATLELAADLPTATGVFTTLTFTLPLGAAVAAAEAEPAPSAASASSASGASRSALSVLHGMAYIGSLLSGTSPLHLKPDGSPIAPPPSADTVKDSVVGLAVAEHLVTPYTSAVGVVLQADPLDPNAVRQVEVPLAAPAGRSMWQQQQQPEEQEESELYACALVCAAKPMSARMRSSSAFGFRSAAPAGAAQPPVAMEKSKKKKEAVKAEGGGGFMRGLFSGATSRAAATPPPVPSMESCAPAAEASCAPSPSFSSSSGSGHPQTSTSVPLGAAAPAPARRSRCLGGAAACDDMGLACCDEDEDAAVGDDDDGTATGAGASTASPISTSSNSAATSKAASADGRPADSATKASPKRVAQLPPGQLLSFLNLSRTTEGYWSATQQLAEALGLTTEDVMGAAAPNGGGDGCSSSALAAARPAALSGDAWATVLVLASLRKHLAATREVWADMEAKALGWLAGVWPAAGAKSAAATVLAALKLMP